MSTKKHLSLAEYVARTKRPSLTAYAARARSRKVQNVRLAETANQPTAREVADQANDRGHCEGWLIAFLQ